MGERLGITVRGMGRWPIWGHHWPLANLGSPSGRPTGQPTKPFRVLSDTHLDIRGFTQRSLGQQVRVHFWTKITVRGSQAEASRASDRPGCNRESTCSTSLLVMPGLLRSANSKAFFNSSTASV